MQENLFYGIILIILCTYIIYIYNSLIKLRAKHTKTFLQIDIELKRRYELIPNLVESTKRYINSDSETLRKVIRTRNHAHNSLSKAKNDLNENSLKELARNENSFVNALSSLNFVMEDYPDLKADRTIKNLQKELYTTENKISFSRQSYNDSVMLYNMFRKSFPHNIISTVIGHNSDINLLEFNDASKIQENIKSTF
jgi:LemA protein